MPTYQQLRDAIKPLTRASQDGAPTCALGNIPTRHPRVRVFWSQTSLAREPVLLDAGLVIVASGRKVGYHASHEHVYDQENYLVVSAPIPFECTTIATPEAPLLGLFLQIELAELHELVTIAQPPTTPVTSGIGSAPLTPHMYDAIQRLALCLQSEQDTRALGDALLREIIYRALASQHGAMLAQLTQHNHDYARIARVLAMLRADLQAPWSVGDLATHAGMGNSTFHRAFRRITGSAPLQYIKAARLQKARSLLRYEGVRVKDAATSVGYESASQFSREFSRYFHVTPTQARMHALDSIKVVDASR